MKYEAQIIAAQMRPHDVKALRILARRAMGNFERLGAMTGLGKTMIDRFLANGLAEEGTFNAFTGEAGYRLTKLGQHVHAALGQRRSHHHHPPYPGYD